MNAVQRAFREAGITANQLVARGARPELSVQWHPTREGGDIPMKLKDLGHAIVVGEQLLSAVLSVEGGGTGNIEISIEGKKYDVAITPAAA